MQQCTLIIQQAFGLYFNMCPTLAYITTSVVTETASPAPSSLQMALASLGLGGMMVSTRSHLHVMGESEQDECRAFNED